jgi:hypothetical protein
MWCLRFQSQRAKNHRHKKSILSSWPVTVANKIKFRHVFFKLNLISLVLNIYLALVRGIHFQ